MGVTWLPFITLIYSEVGNYLSLGSWFKLLILNSKNWYIYIYLFIYLFNAALSTYHSTLGYIGVGNILMVKTPLSDRLGWITARSSISRAVTTHVYSAPLGSYNTEAYYCVHIQLWFSHVCLGPCLWHYQQLRVTQIWIQTQLYFECGRSRLLMTLVAHCWLHSLQENGRHFVRNKWSGIVIIWTQPPVTNYPWTVLICNHSTTKAWSPWIVHVPKRALARVCVYVCIYIYIYIYMLQLICIIR